MVKRDPFHFSENDNAQAYGIESHRIMELHFP